MKVRDNYFARLKLCFVIEVWISPCFSCPPVILLLSMHRDSLLMIQLLAVNYGCDPLPRIYLWCECSRTHKMHWIDSVSIWWSLQSPEWSPTMANRFCEWVPDLVDILMFWCSCCDLHWLRSRFHQLTYRRHYGDALLDHHAQLVASYRIWKEFFA